MIDEYVYFQCKLDSSGKSKIWCCCNAGWFRALKPIQHRLPLCYLKNVRIFLTLNGWLIHSFAETWFGVAAERLWLEFSLWFTVVQENRLVSSMGKLATLVLFVKPTAFTFCLEFLLYRLIASITHSIASSTFKMKARPFGRADSAEAASSHFDSGRTIVNMA